MPAPVGHNWKNAIRSAEDAAYAQEILRAWDSAPSETAQTWLLTQLADHFGSTSVSGVSASDAVAGIYDKLSTPQQSWVELKQYAVATEFQSADLQSALVQMRYQDYVGRGAGEILHALRDPSKDRGLVVSPLALRDMTENVLRDLIRQGSQAPQRNVLLVVQGLENMERWRLRLENVFGEDRQVGHQEKDHWQKNGITVQITSVHSLSRLDDGDLKNKLTESGLVILDKEHHVRPVVDAAEDAERKRFARILVQGGWLDESFAATQAPAGHFLLGMTETVTGGAGRIYRNGADLLLAEDLPKLKAEGLIKNPQVEVIRPFSKTEAGAIISAAEWQALSAYDRVSHLYELVDQATTAADGKAPHTVIYAGSQAEAQDLADLLRTDERFQKEVSLVISDSATRTEDAEKYRLGLRSILITVDAMVEGVDEFRTKPADLVIFANTASVGSQRKALQMVGAHLSPEHATRMVDVAGLFETHSDLAGFDPQVYILQNGELKKGSPLSPANVATTRAAGGALEATQVFLVDLFGAQAAHELAQALKTVNTLSPAQLALALNWTTNLATKLMHGEYLPASYTTVTNIGQALGLTEAAQSTLNTAWANDQANRFTAQHPIPENLSDGEKIVLQRARVGFYLNLHGDVNGVDGMQASTLKEYLFNGTTVDRMHFRRFYTALGKIIGGLGQEEATMGFLAEHLGAARVGYYWKPQTAADFGAITLHKLQGLLDTVRQQAGHENDRNFVLVGVKGANGTYVGVRAMSATNAAKLHDVYFKLSFSLKADDTWQLWKLQGSHATEIKDWLVNAKVENLSFTPEVLQKKMQSPAWTAADFGALTLHKLQGLLDAVRQQAGHENDQSFVLVGRKVNGTYIGVRAISVVEATKLHVSYFQLPFTLRADGIWQLEKPQGRGAAEIKDWLVNAKIENLSLTAEALEKKPQIQRTAWTAADFGALTLHKLQGLLDAVRQQAGHENDQSFVLVGRKANSTHSGVHAMSVAEAAKLHVSYFQLPFTLKADGTWQLGKLQGTGAAEIKDWLVNAKIENLSLAAEALEKKPQIKLTPWTAADFRAATPQSLRSMLDAVRQQAGHENDQSFVLVGSKGRNGTHVGVRAVSVAEAAGFACEYFQLSFTLKADGTWQLGKLQGNGAAAIKDWLVNAKIENLSFTTEALEKKSRELHAAWTTADFGALTLHKLQGLLDAVRQQAGHENDQSFVLVGRKANGTHVGVRAVSVAEAAGFACEYFQLSFTLKADGTWQLEKLQGGGAAAIKDWLVNAKIERLSFSEAALTAKSRSDSKHPLGYVNVELLASPFTLPWKLASRIAQSEVTGPVLGNLFGDYISKKIFGDEKDFDAAHTLGFMALDASVRSVVQAPLQSSLSGVSPSVARFAKNNVPFLITSAFFDLARGEFHPVEYAKQVPAMAIGSITADVGMVALAELFGKRVIGIAGRFIHPAISFTVMHGIGELRAAMEKTEKLEAAATQIAASQSLRYPQLHSPSAQQEALWNYVSERLNFSQAGKDYQELQIKINAQSKNPLEYLGEPILPLPFVTESDIDLLLTCARKQGRENEVYEGFRKSLEIRIAQLQNEITQLVQQVTSQNGSEGKVIAVLMQRQLETQLANYQQKALLHLAKREDLNSEEQDSLKTLLVINQNLQQQQRTAEFTESLSAKHKNMSQTELDELHAMRFDCAHELSTNQFCQLQNYTDNSGSAWQQRLREDTAGVDVAYEEEQPVLTAQDIPLEDFSRYNDLPLDEVLIALQERGLELFPAQKKPLMQNSWSAVAQQAL